MHEEKASPKHPPSLRTGPVAANRFHRKPAKLASRAAKPASPNLHIVLPRLRRGAATQSPVLPSATEAWQWRSSLQAAAAAELWGGTIVQVSAGTLGGFLVGRLVALLCRILFLRFCCEISKVRDVIAKNQDCSKIGGTLHGSSMVLSKCQLDMDPT